jgi:hypothetical protein
MKKTQQSFAVEVLQCAIGTIARWETYDPPKSDALIRLATIAHEQHLEELVEVFKQTFVDDLNAQYGLDLTRATHNGSNKKRRQ